MRLSINTEQMIYFTSKYLLLMGIARKQFLMWINREQCKFSNRHYNVVGWIIVRNLHFCAILDIISMFLHNKCLIFMK